ncbi:unnamed protein product [Cylicocyclus nassatus]|uniref:Uncharacterized protein n=1 Tax=Cylicocyclus nassatus TaxID=53992 RepID=A0AA36H0Q1_CYLNA|nr:unnamed protein product [Cylicocyclus nassatus]
MRYFFKPIQVCFTEGSRLEKYVGSGNQQILNVLLIVQVSQRMKWIVVILLSLTAAERSLTAAENGQQRGGVGDFVKHFPSRVAEDVKAESRAADSWFKRWFAPFIPWNKKPTKITDLGPGYFSKKK